MDSAGFFHVFVHKIMYFYQFSHNLDQKCHKKHPPSVCFPHTLADPKKSPKKGGGPDLGQNRPPSIGMLIADPRAKTPYPNWNFHLLFPSQKKYSNFGRKHRFLAIQFPKWAQKPQFSHNFGQKWPKFCTFPTLPHKHHTGRSSIVLFLEM